MKPCRFLLIVLLATCNMVLCMNGSIANVGNGQSAPRRQPRLDTALSSISESSHSTDPECQSGDSLVFNTLIQQLKHFNTAPIDLNGNSLITIENCQVELLAACRKNNAKPFRFTSNQLSYLDKIGPFSFYCDLEVGLTIDGENGLDRGFVKELATLVHTYPSILSELNIFGLNNGDFLISSVLKAITKIKSVKALRLQDNGLTNNINAVLFVYFGYNPQLQVIDLSYNQLGDEAIALVVKAISQKGPLRVLDLYSNPVSSNAAAVIANHMMGHGLLKEFAISIRDDKLEGVLYLAKMIKKNPHLTLLQISSRAIGNGGFKYIAYFLKNDKSRLQVLQLNDCSLNDSGIEAIAGALKTNTQLKVLALAGNQFSQTGAAFLAGTLKSNIPLEGLDLSNNDIGEIGAKAISEGLKQNNRLKELALAKCNIPYKGIKSVASALKKNTALWLLDLSDNFLQLESIQRLVIAIRENRALKTLTIRAGNDFNPAGVEASKLYDEMVSSGVWEIKK